MNDPFFTDMINWINLNTDKYAVFAGNYKYFNNAKMISVLFCYFFFCCFAFLCRSVRYNFNGYVNYKATNS